MRRPHPRPAAFTLIELLIVIGIFVLLLAIAVPAFSSMLYSSEQSMAENAMRIGVAAGRDAAIRAGAGRDGAAVFVFENFRLQVLPCVQSGVVDDVDAQGNAIRREIFVPVNGFEPVKMPRGWTLRGYVSANTIDDSWYKLTYSSSNLRSLGNWVFPETSFFDDSDPTGTDTGSGAAPCGVRCTFMVRFEGGTGILKPDPTEVLVLFPSQATAFRTGQVWGTWRADEEPDLGRFITRVHSAPVSGTNSLTLQNRQLLVGAQSVDTILVRGVEQIAMCSEKSLAAAIASLDTTVRLNDLTGSLYLPPPPQPATVPSSNVPKFVGNLSGSDGEIGAISKWIENRLYQGNAASGTLVPSDARIFTVQRYSGVLQEVTGSRNASGVAQ